MLFNLMLLASLCSAPDSLEAATVAADRHWAVSRTDTLSLHPLDDAALALQQFPGLLVGDYGGLAGLKSVSLRGFGSPHTAIYLDGLRVGNVQSGQNDLGFIDIQSAASVVADYAQNSIHFVSPRPVFPGGRPVSGELRLQGGSFGTCLPYGRLNVRIGERWSLSAQAGGTITKGDFPVAGGVLRTNNDLRQFRGGTDVYGRLAGGDFHAKIYYSGAERGTPGSLDWPSADRQQDRNAFGQFLFRKAFGPRYSLQMSGKVGRDRLRYRSEWGDNRYAQTEFQLNSTQRFRIRPWWELSLQADAVLDRLQSDLYQNVRAVAEGGLATSFRWTRLQADAALLYTGTFDTGSRWQSLSPSVDLRFALTEGWDIVAFGRRAYRTPTFNELYYPAYGNPDLRAEDAFLTDIGTDFRRSLGKWTLRARTDGYGNFLRDKILSAPSAEDPGIWLPYNVGKVQAFGTNLQAGFDYAAASFSASAEFRYGWQQAIDKTPESLTYGEQIPYAARHTVTAQGRASVSGWAVSVLWQLRAGRRDSFGSMPDWDRADLCLSKRISLPGRCCLDLQLAVRNLWDSRYEIVSGYPLPGRHCMAGLSIGF